jgi:hypothetical protein
MSPEIFQGGYQGVDLSFTSSLNSFNEHLMCKDHDNYYNPIEPTDIFGPNDTKAEFLTTVSMKKDEIVEWQWYYRNDSSRGWVICPLPPEARQYHALIDGLQVIAGDLDIAGYWPGVYFPRAYKVDVYFLNNPLLFSEFFEVTNGGLDSPRMCTDFDVNGDPVNMRSRFTVGVDTQAYHYLRFDNMAYFNQETENSHNFTTVWIQPSGSVYKTHSCVFGDYKDSSLNYWEYGLILNDSISINSTTPIGNWKVEVYVDSYLFNDTWTPYGPIATTPFIVGNSSVADWTFMAYLDGDNTLENASIDVFLKMANASSSQKVNVVAQLDRGSSPDQRYGNWTGCKRFNITSGMTPDPENAVEDLGDVDMGATNTLRDFLNWTINDYPANSYFLAIWDHGSGCMGVCYDSTSGNDTLLLPRLSDSMTGLPVIIDDVLIDACGMTMAEVAYQIKDFANILIGPEGLGYAPAPYDSYLATLTNNTSISPTALAKEIVKEYIDWCLLIPSNIVPAATMSAIDLTKITGLAKVIDDFATTLKEDETLYHQQIGLARSLTTGYEGPYAGQFGYFFDLYNLAQQVYAQVSDERLRNVSSQVMAALSIGNTIIAESNKNDPGSNGLAIFFPSRKADYDLFANLYEAIAFARETTWDELVKYNLSGYLLTIQTSYPNVQVEADEDNYTTGGDGRIQLYLLPGPHRVNVPSSFSTAPDSREVFVQWNDSNTSTARTFSLNGDLTAEAEYETQYRLIMEANFGTTYPSLGEHWYNSSSSVRICAISPTTTFGEQYERYVWQEWAQGVLAPIKDNVTSIRIDGPINESATWTHQYFLTVTSVFGSPTPSSGWFDAGTAIIESVISPVSGSSGTQYVCTSWTGTGDVLPTGISTSTNLTLNEPSSIAWNWKTQYLLTVHTDPMGLNPQPSISPAASWYDNYATVTCTAQQINGYTFQQWSSQSESWDIGTNPINITVDGPYDLTAQYVRAQAWWEILVNPNAMQAILAAVGTTLTVGLVGGAWFRSRKRRSIVKAFLAEADDVYSRLKTEPKKCEEELYALRNTILEGLTDGKITQENYEIIDKRIDKYVAELSEAQGRRGVAPAKRDDA